jgi:hypothetical protein
MRHYASRVTDASLFFMGRHSSNERLSRLKSIALADGLVGYKKSTSARRAGKLENNQD